MPAVALDSFIQGGKKPKPQRL